MDTIAALGFPLLMAFWLVFLIFREPIAATTYRWQDDSYYYLLPAWNWGRTGQITTSWVGEVYGFQPLWFLVQAALCKVCTNLQVALKLITGVQAFLFIGGTAMLGVVTARIVNSRWVSPFVVAAATIALPLQVSLLSGKENTLGLFLLASFLVVITQSSWEVRRRLLFGALILGLLGITRTNYAVSCVVVITAILLKFRPSWRVSVATCLAFLLPVCGWFGFASSRFHSAMPLSGHMKILEAKATLATLFADHGMAIPTKLLGQDALASVSSHTAMPSEPRAAVNVYKNQVATILSVRTLAFLVGIFGLLGLFAKPVGKCDNRRLWQVAGLLLAFVVPNALFNIFAMSPVLSYTTWYLMPEQALMIVAVPTLIGLAMSRNVLGTFKPAFLALLAVFGVASKFRVNDWEVLSARYEHPDYQCYKNQDQLVAEFRKVWKKDDLIVCFNSGYFNYLLSDAKMENLDGLTASLPYYKTVGDSIVVEGADSLSPKLWKYCHQIHAKYLIDFDKADWTPSARPFENRMDLSTAELVVKSAPFHEGQERIYAFRL